MDMYKRIKNGNSKGFSTVELLVSLVVASIFLFAGFSFYNSIIKFSLESRNRANADRIAYDYLRRYESTVGATCTSTSTPVSAQAIPSSENTTGMNSPTITVVLSCPVSAVPSLFKVTSRVQYREGGVAKTVEQEVYASQ